MNKKFNLEEYKKTIQLADTPLKKDSFIVLNEAIQETLGLPGIPLGHTTQIFGKSDSGKSSLAFHIAAQAQKQGILPIFLITEGKVSWDRAQAMGVDVNNAIIENTLYIEDIFKSIDKFLADQAQGRLPVDIVIIVDSIGNTISVDSLKENADGTVEMGGAMMKASKVLREKMRVFGHKINNTRKVSYPKSAGLVFINHAYTVPPQFPGGMSSIAPYGGEGIWYAASLVIRTKKTKTLKATVSGVEKGFGIVSKLTVDKNHVSNVTNSGEFVVTADTIIPNQPQAIKDYKDEHKADWQTFKVED